MGWARGLPHSQLLLLLFLVFPSSLNADSGTQATPAAQRLRSAHHPSLPATVSGPLAQNPRRLIAAEPTFESQSPPKSDSEPDKALFEPFKLGNRSTAWFVPESPSNISCLAMFPFGCSGIRDERTCLSSRDGSNKWTEKGVKIRGEPCVWCGGVSCTLGGTSLCEPQDYLKHGDGVAFTAFNTKTFMTIAKCKEGRPVLPEQLPAVNPKAGVGRVMGCGERTYTVPDIMDQYGSCQKFCEVKASVTWPYGKLNWKCGQAWQADGNSCHNLATRGCLENFTDFMEVGLCRCEMVPWSGKQLIVVGWGQCGGEGWTGPTQCEDGLTCKYRNETYSQCLPDVPLGADCWNECNERGGWCGWCGAGRACCREGYADDPAECNRVTNWTKTWHHQCVNVGPPLETTLPPATTTVVSPTVPPIPVAATTTVTSTYTITQTNTTAVPVPVMGWWEWVEGALWWLLPLLLLLCCLLAGLIYLCMGTTKRKRGSKRTTRGKVSMDDSNITSSSRPTETESETSLFDLLDRNHDGIVTMEEFQEAMGGRDAMAYNTMTMTAVQPVQVVQPMQVVQVTGVQTVASATSTQVSTQVSPLSTPVMPPPMGTQAMSFNMQQPMSVSVSVPTSRVGSAVIPVARPTGRQNPDLFDLIDENHDGTITAEEFNRAMGTQQVQQAPRVSQTGRVDLYTISPMPMQTSRVGSAVVPVAPVPMQQMGPGMPFAPHN